MTRGDQRERDRAKTMKKQQEKSKGTQVPEGMTLAQKKVADAEIMRQKQLKAAAEKDAKIPGLACSLKAMSRAFSSVPDIFELEAEAGIEPKAAESKRALQIDFSAEDPDSLYKHYDYAAVQRMQHSRKVLCSHSELVWHARKSGKSVAFTRSRFLAKTLAEWCPQLDQDLFLARAHHQRIPDASVSITLVSPSNDFGDFAEVSRPGSLYSVGSASYTTSPFKPPRQRTE